ncbi:MAG: hypothetical protein GF307_06775 [candidate division Zixibacteria bacterium]|nr:hypothetical protein [candidate division Zixibacteria bacterium]
MRAPSLVSVIIVISILAGACGNKPKYKLDMNNSRGDVEALVERALLKSVINERDIPGYDQIRRKGDIYISDTFLSFWHDNSSGQKLTQDLIPEFRAYRLHLMSPEELQERTKEVGDFVYLQFGHIKVFEDTALVELSTLWATNKPEKAAHLTEGGYELKFARNEIHGWIYVGMPNRWTAQ